jgi:dTDP-4-dehydrorhamnose reductase
LIVEELGLSDRLELIERDDQKYKEHPRDARLDTSKIRAHGFAFSDTPEAIRTCIREFALAMS